MLKFLNKGVDHSVDTTGNKLNVPSGTQRSYFLEPEVKASSLSTKLSDMNIKGRSKSTDSNGRSYYLGFTPDVDFYINPDNVNKSTNSPVERGNVLNAGVVDQSGNSVYGVSRDTNDILDNDVPNAYDAFKDRSTYEYLHHLDRGEIPVGLVLGKNSDIYLSSFVETNTDNEDPISFGYDVVIDYDNSPLFNGAVEDFLDNFSNYSELSSRKDVISKFKDQFFKFFDVDIRNILGYEQPRTYYIQKISGLNDLSESISSDKWKQFVDYGKDFITLTLKEDVSVNGGYIAALYRILTWSRLHGKKMIPDNLLRFDVEITVTESRKFNRVIKNSDSTLDQYADLVSRYKYKLYECQFFFENLSHGNEIDMSNLGYTDGFDLKFNYKYTTLRFEKFTNEASIIGASVIKKHISLDNSLSDISKVESKNSGSFTVNNNTIVLNPLDYVLNKYTPNGETTTYNPILLPINADQSTDPFSSLNKTPNTSYQDKVNNMNKPKNIKSVTNQSNLLQRTLENISSTFKSDVNKFIYKLKEDLLNFIPGNFVGGFTEDGYEYNIPAYYINKAFNTANNTLRKSLGTINQNIYQQKNILTQGFLQNINDGIDYGNNLLNNELGKLGGNNGSNNKDKPSNIYKTEDVNALNGNSANIYGNSNATPIVYSGSYDSSDNAPDTPAHHYGTNINIYNNEPDYPDTPAHHTGTNIDIYGNEPDYPDTPSHHVGSTSDIYNNEPDYPDTPSHHVGSTSDIYNNEPNYPDTPSHHTGTNINIYNNEPDYPDTPTHHVGSTSDIYDNEPDYPDTPIHHTGVNIDIYGNEPDYTDTPTHHVGSTSDIYETHELPTNSSNTSMDIYNSEPVNIDSSSTGNKDIYLERDVIEESNVNSKNIYTVDNNIEFKSTKKGSIYDYKNVEEPMVGKTTNIYANKYNDTDILSKNKDIYNKDIIEEIQSDKPLNIYNEEIVPKMSDKAPLSIYDKKESNNNPSKTNNLDIYSNE